MYWYTYKQLLTCGWCMNIHPPLISWQLRLAATRQPHKHACLRLMTCETSVSSLLFISSLDTWLKPKAAETGDIHLQKSWYMLSSTHSTTSNKLKITLSWPTRPIIENYGQIHRHVCTCTFHKNNRSNISVLLFLLWTPSSLKAATHLRIAPICLVCVKITHHAYSTPGIQYPFQRHTTDMSRNMHVVTKLSSMSYLAWKQMPFLLNYVCLHSTYTLPLPARYPITSKQSHIYFPDLCWA